jgi:hypothetical protein
MNFLRILIMLFPMFCFASFPIQEDIRFIDTVLVNEKLNEAVVVDSTSKYPLEKETLTEYRARLKKQLYSSSSEEKKLPLLTKVFLIVLIIIVLILIIAMVASNDTSTSRSGQNSFDLNDFLDPK